MTCSVRKNFLKFRKLTGKRNSNFTKKRHQHLRFPVNFAVSDNTYFAEHLLTAASDIRTTASVHIHLKNTHKEKAPSNKPPRLTKTNANLAKTCWKEQTFVFNAHLMNHIFQTSVLLIRDNGMYIIKKGLKQPSSHSCIELSKAVFEYR